MRLIATTALLALCTLPSMVGSVELTDNDRHNIMQDCRVATGTKTRVSWITNQAAANECYNQRIEDMRQAELVQSVIDANNAEAAYWRDKTRQKNRDHYPEK